MLPTFGHDTAISPRHLSLSGVVEYWGRNEILNTGRVVFSVKLLA
jgi:hypothetical protein